MCKRFSRLLFPSTNIILGTDGSFGGSTNAYICYAWKEVSGVSKFGVYDGNGGANNIVLGFHPRLFIIKRRGGTGNWHMYDYYRSYNPTGVGAADGTGHSLQPPLFGDGTGADGSQNTTWYGSGDYDAITWYTSGSDKGVRIHTNDGGVNGGSDQYIYMAFA